MTSKLLLHGYPAGYVLGSAYSGAIVEATASVGGSGLFLPAGGVAVIKAGGSIHADTSHPGLSLGAFGIVHNYGSIFGEFGVELASGQASTSSLLNPLNAQIYGYFGGLLMESRASVNNGGLVSAPHGYIATFAAGGTMTNGGTLSGQRGVRFSGAAGVVTNSGTITDTTGFGVALTAGGTVVNTGLVAAQYGVSMSTGFLNNGGFIHALGGVGVSIGGAGTVTNGGSVVATGGGILVTGLASVTNNGSVKAGGDAGVLIGGGTIINNGYVYGLIGVEMFAGALDNALSTSVITGSRAVYAPAKVTLTNFGALTGTGAGKAAVDLLGGGSFFNQTSSAKVTGPRGLYSSLRLTLTNFGTITGTDTAAGYGVVLGAGGVVTNGSPTSVLALIQGVSGFILKGALSTLANYGTIAGSTAATGDVGVQLLGGGSLVNGSLAVTKARISGGVGVVMNGTATFTDFGAVVGAKGVAVQMSGVHERLIVEPGATFTGSVAAGGGGIEFNTGGGTANFAGGHGSLAGASAFSFSGGGFYQFDPGAWTVSGLIKTGETVAGQGASITFSTPFTISGGLFEAQGGVANTSTVTVVGTGGVSGFEALGSGLTLTGGGAIKLTGPTAHLYGLSNQRLDNVDNIIAGAGAVGLGKLAVINGAAGVIEATGGVMTLNPASLVNNGLLEGAATGTLVISNTTIDQSGGGSTEALAGGRVNVQGAKFLGGAIGGAGAFAVVTTGTLAGVGGATLAVTGKVTVGNGATLDAYGYAEVDGYVDLTGGSSGATLYASQNLHLLGPGKVGLKAGGDGFIVGEAGVTITNSISIVGAGDLGGGVASVFDNAYYGRVINGTADPLTLNFGVATIVNDGQIRSSGLGGVAIDSPVVNNGDILATTGTVVLDGAVIGTGTCFVGAGTLDAHMAFNNKVVFTGGSTGVLQIDQPATFQGTVSGLSKTGANSIDFRGVGFVAGKTSVSYKDNGKKTGGVLTIANGTITAQVTLTGDYSASVFTAAADGHGGVSVKDPPAAPLASAMAAFPQALETRPMSGASLVGGRTWTAPWALAAAPNVAMA